MLLDEQGDLEGLARRAGLGDHNAAFYLAEQLLKCGKEKEGISVLRCAANAGDDFAAQRLADHLLKRHMEKEAASVLRRAANAGSESAARRLGRKAEPSASQRKHRTSSPDRGAQQ
jgi:hypothetical protein